MAFRAKARGERGTMSDVKFYRCNHCELTFRTHEGYCVQGRFWARDAAGAWIRTDEM